MQQRRLAQQVDSLRSQLVGERPLRRQVLGEQPDIALDTRKMAAARVVAKIAKGRQGFDDGVLQLLQLARATAHFEFQVFALVAQEIGIGLQLQMGTHRARTIGGLTGLPR